MYFQSTLLALLLACSSVSALAVDGTSASITELAVPESLSRWTPKQLTRAEIVRRQSRRNQALQPRQSAKVYPTCSDSGVNAIPSSGFVSFAGYYVGRGGDYDISGSLKTVTSAIACAQFCQETEGCIGFYWDKSPQTCSMRKGSPTGTSFGSRGATLGTFALAGDCASLAPQINNATIMAACCNNAAPSAHNVCTASQYKGFDNWSVGGQRKFGTENQLTGTGNRNTAANYQACINSCNAYTKKNLPGNNAQGCTGAVYDGYKRTDGTNTCFLYGGSPTKQVSQTDTVYVTFVKGTCAQNAANGVDASDRCCDST